MVTASVTFMFVEYSALEIISVLTGIATLWLAVRQYKR